MKMKKFIGTGIALALLAGFTSTASALSIRISDNNVTPTIVVDDNDAADRDAAAGVMDVSQAFGAFSTNVVLGSSTMTPDSLHLTNFVINSNSAGTITLELTETGFTAISAMTDFLAKFGGTVNGVGSVQFFADDTNTAFGQGALIASSAGLSGAFSDTIFNTVALTANDLYSLTIVTTITHNSANQISSFDSDLQIPEPTSLALIGLGLLAFGFKRKQRS